MSTLCAGRFGVGRRPLRYGAALLVPQLGGPPRSETPSGDEILELAALERSLDEGARSRRAVAVTVLGNADQPWCDGVSKLDDRDARVVGVDRQPWHDCHPDAGR